MVEEGIGEQSEGKFDNSKNENVPYFDPRSHSR